MLLYDGGMLQLDVYLFSNTLSVYLREIGKSWLDRAVNDLRRVVTGPVPVEAKSKAVCGVDVAVLPGSLCHQCCSHCPRDTHSQGACRSPVVASHNCTSAPAQGRCQVFSQLI